MEFSEKLSLLMDITKTTNSALARYISLDASYVSRLRSGKRLLPRNDANVRSMAAYFARNCREEYRKKAVSNVLGVNPLPKEPAELTEIITHWLLKEKEGTNDTVEQFLGGLSSIKGGLTAAKGQPLSNQTDHENYGPPPDKISIYYGIEGKRLAVKYFLSEVISLKKPQTLLLFSDEETSWMTGNPAFAKHWADLMFQTLSRGHRIKIIHTVSRDLDEMLNAIGQWMPLYMSGNIEPYFYPKKRDGVFKRTLFILPGTAAVVSESIGDQTAHAANLLLHDPAAVASYEVEFLKYLHLCRPLMRIFHNRNREECLATLKEFENEHCNALMKSVSLALLTMPDSLFSEILNRNNLVDPETIEYHKQRIKNFHRLLQTCTFSEIISLPEPQAVIDGQIKIALSDMLEEGAIYYTPKEYLRHLQSIAEHLKIHENYHVHFINGTEEDRYAVYVKEESGVIVAKTSLPPAVLAMSEGNMTAAFWDFLKTMVGAKAYDHPQNKNMILKLNEYIERLEQLL